MDLGVAKAGFDVRVAVEFDRDSAASLRANQFLRRPEAVIERSIVEVTTDEMLAVADLRIGEAALLVGGLFLFLFADTRPQKSGV